MMVDPPYEHFPTTNPTCRPRIGSERSESDPNVAQKNKYSKQSSATVALATRGSKRRGKGNGSLRGSPPLAELGA